MIRLAIWSSMRRAQEDDPLLQQQREDVVGALAAVGLLDDHRHDLVDRPIQGSPRRASAGAPRSRASRDPTHESSGTGHHARVREEVQVRGHEDVSPARLAGLPVRPGGRALDASPSDADSSAAVTSASSASAASTFASAGYDGLVGFERLRYGLGDRFDLSLHLDFVHCFLDRVGEHRVLGCRGVRLGLQRREVDAADRLQQHPDGALAAHRRREPLLHLRPTHRLAQQPLALVGVVQPGRQLLADLVVSYVDALSQRNRVQNLTPTDASLSLGHHFGPELFFRLLCET